MATQATRTSPVMRYTSAVNMAATLVPAGYARKVAHVVGQCVTAQQQHMARLPRWQRTLVKQAVHPRGLVPLSSFSRGQLARFIAAANAAGVGHCLRYVPPVVLRNVFCATLAQPSVAASVAFLGGCTCLQFGAFVWHYCNAWANTSAQVH